MNLAKIFFRIKLLFEGPVYSEDGGSSPFIKDIVRFVSRGSITMRTGRYLTEDDLRIMNSKILKK